MRKDFPSPDLTSGEDFFALSYDSERQTVEFTYVLEEELCEFALKQKTINIFSALFVRIVIQNCTQYVIAVLLTDYEILPAFIIINFIAVIEDVPERMIKPAVATPYHAA